MIKKGQTNVRNLMLDTFASIMLPYRGIESGIRRALEVYLHLDLIVYKTKLRWLFIGKR